MKMLISKDGMMENDGWHGVGVFLVQKVFTLNIMKRVQSTQGSSSPDSCFFKFVDGKLFHQNPSR